MTPADFKALRKRAGLNQTDWGRSLGYQGTDDAVKVVVSRFETGNRSIPVRTAMLAELLANQDS